VAKANQVSHPIVFEDHTVTLTVTKENQTVPVTKENQTVPVTKENQTVPVTKENQTVPVTKENQTVPVTEENQTVLVTEENQTSATEKHLLSLFQNTSQKPQSNLETRIRSGESYQTEKLEPPEDPEENRNTKLILYSLLGAAAFIGAVYFTKRFR
jgi:cobalamin biosynthesis Mg chelatase CobN